MRYGQDSFMAPETIGTANRGWFVVVTTTKPCTDTNDPNEIQTLITEVRCLKHGRSIP